MEYFKLKDKVIVSIKDDHEFEGQVKGIIYLVSCNGVDNQLLQVDPDQLKKT